MRNASRSVAVTAFVSGLLLTSFVPARAEQQVFNTAQECMQSGDAMHMPVCVSNGDGRWVAQFDQSPGSGGGAFGTFLLFAILWAAAPAVIGGVIASGRGQSVGIAVLLGIVLGWIGLLIVVFLLKPEITTAARSVIDNANTPRAPAATVRAPAKDTAARLGELDSLKAQGLITENEYAARREAILAEI